MNSVASVRERAVKGSNVESVRVANDIVNILLACLSDFLLQEYKKFATYFKA
jgi:hypothetical protein